MERRAKQGRYFALLPDDQKVKYFRLTVASILNRILRGLQMYDGQSFICLISLT